MGFKLGRWGILGGVSGKGSQRGGVILGGGLRVGGGLWGASM